MPRATALHSRDVTLQLEVLHFLVSSHQVRQKQQIVCRISRCLAVEMSTFDSTTQDKSLYNNNTFSQDLQRTKTVNAIVNTVSTISKQCPRYLEAAKSTNRSPSHSECRFHRWHRRSLIAKRTSLRYYEGSAVCIWVSKWNIGSLIFVIQTTVISTGYLLNMFLGPALYGGDDLEVSFEILQLSSNWFGRHHAVVSHE